MDEKRELAAGPKALNGPKPSLPKPIQASSARLICLSSYSPPTRWEVAFRGGVMGMMLAGVV